MTAYAERIARVEVEVQELKASFNEFKEDTHEEFQGQNLKLERMDSKLDSLIAIRNKGAGILWLVSSVLGSAGILAVFEIMNFFRR